MRNEKPAVRTSWPRCVSLIGFSVSCLLLSTLLPFASTAGAQGNTVLVTGAERVFVRRGPGTEFPPFATLTKGSTVEVQEMRGEWARITTASGQTGYINSTFLALPGEREKEHTAASPAPSATAPAVTTPVAAAGASEAAALRAATERNKNLEAQVHGLQQELADQKTRAEATPACAAASTPMPGGPAAEQLHSELARLTVAVENMQRRLDVLPVTEVPSANAGSGDGSSHLLSPGAVLLGMLGVLAGWLFGSSYGRRQERGRRSRIRF